MRARPRLWLLSTLSFLSNPTREVVPDNQRLVHSAAPELRPTCLTAYRLALTGIASQLGTIPRAASSARVQRYSLTSMSSTRACFSSRGSTSQV